MQIQIFINRIKKIQRNQLIQNSTQKRYIRKQNDCLCSNKLDQNLAKLN